MADPHVVIKFRRGTAEEWSNSSPQPYGEILKLGEPGYEKDTGRLKIGDGISGWNELEYITNSIVVEDIDKTVSEILVPGSGISFNFDDTANTLTLSQNPIQGFSNNSVLTNDGSSTGIVAEPSLTYDGYRLRIDCTCPSGNSGLTVIGDQKSTTNSQTVYGDEETIETEDGVISIRPTSRYIFGGARGSASDPEPLEVGDNIFIIRGDARNPHGTLNTQGLLDSRTLRITGSVSDSGTTYLGSTIKFETSSGDALWDNALTFDHNADLKVNGTNVSLDGHSHTASDITDFDDAVINVVGEGGGGGTILPYLQLTNDPFVVLAANLGTPVEFTRTADGIQTDAIDDGLTLARGAVGALYNVETQIEYNNSTHAIDGAEWNSDGWGDLLNLSSRSYTTLRSALNGVIGENIIGSELVMHDTINDKYYKFSFSDWGQNNGGSFAYTRTLVTNPNYFVKNDYGSEIDTFIEDDPVGDGIGITRGENQGIYNPYREENWNENNSPAGTEWNADGWENLSDIESRTYSNFYDAVGGQLGNNVVGANLIMHIISTDIYYAVKFLSWTQGGNGGGFSYVKYGINLSEIDEGVTFADGTVLKSAAGIGQVKLTASGNRRIEEVYGSATVTVTPIETINMTTTASRSATNENVIWLDGTTTTIDEILNDLSGYGITDGSSIEFSLDNNTWYKWGFGTSYNGNERGYSLYEQVSYNAGDTIYFRYNTGGIPQVWWDKNNLPGGSANFRGATIDYHAYTGEGTFIGTIHIVDDDGEENIAHTEVSSGSTDSENDDLWFVQNEGTISYRRMDGEGKTLKIQWAAKVFYGSELYD